MKNEDLKKEINELRQEFATLKQENQNNSSYVFSKKRRTFKKWFMVPLCVLSAMIVSALLIGAQIPHTFNTGQMLSATKFNENLDFLFVRLNPIGSITPYGGNTAPDQWLLCDGSQVSRTMHADLYAVIGDNFGAGDGSTTFHLPDLRGKFIRGFAGDLSTDVDPDVLGRIVCNTGGNAGNAVGSCQNDAFQGHAHTTHAFIAANTGQSSWDTIGGGLDSSTGSGTYEPSEYSDFGLPKTAKETRPKNVSFNYIIKY